MENITFHCAKCGKRIEVEPKRSGRPISCGDCGAIRKCPGIAGACDLSPTQKHKILRLRLASTLFPYLLAVVAIAAALALAAWLTGAETLLAAAALTAIPAYLCVLAIVIIGVPFRTAAFGDGGIQIVWIFFCGPVAFIKAILGYVHVRRAIRQLAAPEPAHDTAPSLN